MQEPYGKGLATRPDPESCAGHGNMTGEALTGAWIPKADGRQRPLGIAALEDKIVQQAVKTVLEQVYEERFPGLHALLRNNPKGNVHHQT